MQYNDSQSAFSYPYPTKLELVQHVFHHVVININNVETNVIRGVWYIPYQAEIYPCWKVYINHNAKLLRLKIPLFFYFSKFSGHNTSSYNSPITFLEY
jgi:hypothetical protein